MRPNAYTIPLALAALAGLASRSASATVLYTQPTDLDGAFASQNDTTGGLGAFATAYDNFTLGSAATITSATNDQSIRKEMKGRRNAKNPMSLWNCGSFWPKGCAPSKDYAPDFRITRSSPMRSPPRSAR